MSSPSPSPVVNDVPAPEWFVPVHAGFRGARTLRFHSKLLKNRELGAEPPAVHRALPSIYTQRLR